MISNQKMTAFRSLGKIIFPPIVIVFDSNHFTSKSRSVGESFLEKIFNKFLRLDNETDNSRRLESCCKINRIIERWRLKWVNNFT